MRPFARPALALVLAFLAVGARAAPRPLDWEPSIVLIEAPRIQYDPAQPWSRQEASTQKTGVAVSSSEILTTADWLQDATMVRVQKEGRGAWRQARLSWVDYHANLATLTVSDPSFWKGLRPAPLARRAPAEGEVQIHRFSDDLAQTWPGSVSKVLVRPSQRSFVHVLTLEIVSEINGAGWSEAVVKGGQLVGLVSGQAGNRLLAIPSPFIRFVLAARGKKPYAGLGYYDFDWEYAKNPAVARFLGLDGEPRGVIVTAVSETSAFAPALKPRDLILAIDGFPIDANGDYQDPEYGRLSFYNLETRGRLAGDEVRFQLWRERKLVEVSARLPKADYAADLVPAAVYDRPPEYLVAGGLVLQPLTVPTLQAWGANWWSTAPFRLGHYARQEATKQQPHRVFLSTVLPDPFNLGYQDYSSLVVDKINGRGVSSVAEALEALRRPEGGFHLVEFVASGDVQRLVLDASRLDEATARVLKRYGIQRPYFINAPATP